MGRQAWFVNWFCSSFLYINTKKYDYNRFNIFLKDLRTFGPSKVFPVTRFVVTSLLVTSLLCVVTPVTNSPVNSPVVCRDLQT